MANETQKTMDIRARPGTKICYAYPNNGYPYHQDRAQKYLKPGATYTVMRTIVDNWHTDVFLEERPGIPFNSVMFAPVEENNDEA